MFYIINITMRILSFDVGLRNLASCLVELDPAAALPFPADGFPGSAMERVRVVDWRVVDAMSGAGRRPDVDEVCDGVYARLDELLEAHGMPDVVLIENQPCMRNPVMKSVQVMIYSYYRMLTRTSGVAIRVAFVNATLKLAGTAAARGASYKDRKAASVASVAAWLPPGGAKKRDDLADCLLQALQWLRRGSLSSLSLL